LADLSRERDGFSYHISSAIIKQRGKKSGMKILIVDDEKALCDTLEHYLKKRGHETRAVHDFKSADEALLVEKFNLIFLDYRISSQHTGRDLLFHAKRLNLKTPIVMMSAYKTRDNEIEMRSLGVQYYLGKPFKLAEIDEILKQVSGSC
jgi:DNA-binding response OmpR family regulator